MLQHLVEEGNGMCTGIGFYIAGDPVIIDPVPLLGMVAYPRSSGKYGKGGIILAEVHVHLRRPDHEFRLFFFGFHRRAYLFQPLDRL